ncbi:MAG: helix-hairpin-helix domain-containing protein [Bryobacteraceae bacterium]
MAAHYVNIAIARRLREVGELLHVAGGNPFRIRAYRNAARKIERLSEPLVDILATGGSGAIAAALGTGERLSASIGELVQTGRLRLLDRLRRRTDPEALLLSVPSIGVTRAKMLLDQGIGSLEDLEAAAHDGRLAQAGFGKKSLVAVRNALEARLGAAITPPQPAAEAPAGEILDVDREYRRKAAAGELRRIAPRRFNPSRAAWLPILHTKRGPRSYTALYSNTARAHQLGKTDDWVVIYEGSGGPQWTVVTETGGALAGQRVVRGREKECAVYFSTSLGECA